MLLGHPPSLNYSLPPQGWSFSSSQYSKKGAEAAPGSRWLEQQGGRYGSTKTHRYPGLKLVWLERCCAQGFGLGAFAVSCSGIAS